MTGLLQDLRYTLRELRNSPGFALVRILTPGLGIAANAVVFSGINSLLLERPAISSPERVFFLEKPGGRGGANNAYPVYLDLCERVSTFSLAPAGIPALRIARTDAGRRLREE